MTTHLHITLTLRIAGALPPLPHTSQWRFAELGTGATSLLQFPMQEPTSIINFSYREMSLEGQCFVHNEIKSEVKWCNVSEMKWCKWSDVTKWSEVMSTSEVIWLKWSDVSYGEVFGDKCTLHIMVTLYWGYLIVLWLFHLVCILYCCCFNLFRNVWVCVCGSVLTIVWVFWWYVCLYLLCFVLFVLCFCIVSFMCIDSYLFCLY
jgi:hypothetical protein